MKDELKRYLAKIGSKGGKKAAANMTPEERTERARSATAGLTPRQRSERARKAVQARWSKTKRGKQ
jgi:hypothetical protein